MQNFHRLFAVFSPFRPRGVPLKIIADVWFYLCSSSLGLEPMSPAVVRLNFRVSDADGPDPSADTFRDLLVLRVPV